MKKLLRYGLLALFALIAVRTLASAPDATEVLRADEARLAAMIKGDVVALDAALAEDCLYVHSYGAAQTKSEFVAAFRTGALAYKKMEYAGKPQVRFYGNDVAVVTGRMDLEVMNEEGRRLKPALLLTAVYVREGRSWKLASYQSTTAAPPR